MTGFFISFEGPEGSGKSTHIQALAKALEANGHQICITREPGGTLLGQDIRGWLLHRGGVAPWSELLLFMADRAQHIHEVIHPALTAGKVVLCDRFMDSTTAYQHAGRGFPLATIQTLHDLSLKGLKPDLTLLLDVDVQVGLQRVRTARRPEGTDQFEQMDTAFHTRIRNAYLNLAKAEPQRFKVLDTTEFSKEQVFDQLLPAVLSRLMPSIRTS